MKIEIELDEIINIKRELGRLERENYELEQKIIDLNEDQNKQKIAELAQVMFEQVMLRVFKDLGYEKIDYHIPHNIKFRHLERQIGENWWNADNLEIELGVKITNLFRGAFLKLGVKDESNV